MERKFEDTYPLVTKDIEYILKSFTMFEQNDETLRTFVINIIELMLQFRYPKDVWAIQCDKDNNVDKHCLNIDITANLTEHYRISVAPYPVVQL